MDNKALGIIETFGLTPAVECADTALKTADVELTGCHYAKNGLVAIYLAGDVSSVTAAVEGGRAAGARIGQVAGYTVIARIARGLDTVFAQGDKKSERTPKNSSGSVNPPARTDESGPVLIAKGNGGASRDALEKMPVAMLRTLARQMDGLSLTRGEIRLARKKELIETINRFSGIEEK